MSEEIKEKLDQLALELQRDLIRILTGTSLDKIIESLDNRIAKFRTDMLEVLSGK